MQKWEYIFLIAGRANETWKIIMLNGREVRDWKNGPSMYDYINQKGEEGWELVSTTYSPVFTQNAYVDSEDYRLVMKRLKV
jgi:hypothetical protein